jgi:hypothetical protein
MKKLFLLSGAILLLFGCEKKTNWPLQFQLTDFIVVDGIITNERKPHIIHLTHTVIQVNEVPKPVSGATVIISSGDSTYNLVENPLNSGIYQSEKEFSCLPDKDYTLIINHENKAYTARTYMVKGFDFRELEYIKNPNNNLYHISWVASPFNYNSPAMWEVFLDWSNVPGYVNANPDTCKARLLFYTLPTLDVSQIFAPMVESIYFPEGTLIRQSRYSLNPDHAEFIRSLLAETSWQGGVFSSTPANVKTNLSDGAIGYFGACDVKTLFLTVHPNP